MKNSSRPPIAVLLPAIVGVAVGAIVTAIVLTRSDALAVLRDRPGVALLAFVVVITATVANLGVRWLRWHAICRAVGVSLPSRPSLRFWLASVPASLTPLAIGELVRSVVLGRGSPRAGRAVAVVWGLERGSDVFALLLIGAFAEGRPGVAVLAVGGGLAALTAYLFVTRRWTGPVDRFGKSALAFGFALVAWSLPAAATAIAAGMLGSGTGIRSPIGAFADSTLFGGITLLPGGAGATGSSLIHHLVAAGSSDPVATALALIVRAGTLWFAATLGLVVFATSTQTIVALARGLKTQTHFDELSSEYADEIPEHMRDRVVRRKLDALAERVGRPGLALDIGCGPGWYAAGLEARGTEVVPIDLAPGQLQQARAHVGGSFKGSVADTTSLPFAPDSFDVVYAVNSLHHLPDRDAQARALAEVVRVLRPGGVFALCEINTENPMFRLYMGYVFPLLRRIDDGTELWLRPESLPSVPGATWLDDTAYQTFLPDFLPRGLVELLSPVERRLEESRLRRWSGHYQAFLVKDAAVAARSDAAPSGVHAAPH